jgi:hypothetical protein
MALRLLCRELATRQTPRARLKQLKSANEITDGARFGITTNRAACPTAG